MPNIILTPKAFAIILLASAGREATSFMIQLPEQLLIEAQSRAVNFAIQNAELNAELKDQNKALEEQLKQLQRKNFRSEKNGND